MEKSPKSLTSEREEFDREFSRLQKDHRSPAAISTAFFIRIKLSQFKLRNLSEDDILSEVYLRGAALTQSGQEIKRVSSWIRATALNVIRERARQQRREFNGSEFFEVDLVASNVEQFASLLALEDELQGDLEVLRRAFQKLTSEDQRLLRLRHLNDLSWKEVVEILQSEDGESISIATARKAGSRSLVRLHRIFQDLKPPDQFN
jgi:DNA-directed RNA polymerase specialized sigma24 family protein